MIWRSSDTLTFRLISPKKAIGLLGFASKRVALRERGETDYPDSSFFVFAA